jgi:hypothetical protein
MKTQLSKCQYELRREGRRWRLTFQGQQSDFPHELGALYVAYLLLPPRGAVHVAALVSHTKQVLGPCVEPADLLAQWELRREVRASIRALWDRQHELERVFQGDREPEPVKAEALRDHSEIADYLRRTPWMSPRAVTRCARAVSLAIRGLFTSLAAAVNPEGKPDEVARAFALHLRRYLRLASACGASRKPAPRGCFIYTAPRRVWWSVKCGKSNREVYPLMKYFVKP